MSNKRVSLFGGALAATMMVCGCARVTVDMPAKQDSEQCLYMKEACGEADAFQKQYDAATREQREEMKTVLSAYRLQCKQAAELCTKSRAQNQTGQ